MNPVSGGDAVRAAIAKSVDELSHSADPQRIVAKSLELIGTATGASRIRIYDNASPPGAPAVSAKRYEWHASDIATAVDPDASADIPDAAAGLAHLLPRLAAGDVRALSPGSSRDRSAISCKPTASSPCCWFLSWRMANFGVKSRSTIATQSAGGLR
jgi:hypothetical protein